MAYNYREHIRSDIYEELSDDYYYGHIKEGLLDQSLDFDSVYEELYDKFWVYDSITGNGSGSYTFNSAEARENIWGNEDLLIDALEDFGNDAESYKKAILDPEYADVTIRCHLLSEVLADVVNELVLEAEGLREEING